MGSLEEVTKYPLTRKASVPSAWLQGLQDSLSRVSQDFTGGCYSRAPHLGRVSLGSLPKKVSEHF